MNAYQETPPCLSSLNKFDGYLWLSSVFWVILEQVPISPFVTLVTLVPSLPDAILLPLAEPEALATPGTAASMRGLWLLDVFRAKEIKMTHFQMHFRVADQPGTHNRGLRNSTNHSSIDHFSHSIIHLFHVIPSVKRCQ